MLEGQKLTEETQSLLFDKILNVCMKADVLLLFMIAIEFALDVSEVFLGDSITN